VQASKDGGCRLATERSVVIVNKAIRIPKCWVCMDKGYVIYKKMVNNAEQEFLAHCSCQLGVNYSYDGTKCEKPSPYWIPPISEVMDPGKIAAENFMRWWKLNKDKDGIVEEMQKRGIPIPKEVA